MPPEDISADLQELKARLKELERRVSALEDPWQIDAAVPKPDRVPGPNQAFPSQQGIFSVCGKAVLGIGGAYVLRAAAESRVVPSWIVLAFGFAYAAAWLFWAAQPSLHPRFARYCYAITSVAILSPMLWEATVRFQMLTPGIASAILAAVGLLATTLAWRSSASPVLWAGMIAAMLTSFLLMIGTRDPVSFTFAILVLAAIGEFVAIRGRWLPLRPIAGIAADFGVLVLIIIVGDPRSIPPEYHRATLLAVTSVVATLFAIYTVSLGFRSLVIRMKIRRLEIAQFAVTVVLAVWAVLRFTDGAGLPLLGVCCLILGAMCLLVVFGFLARHRERPGYYFYAVWSLLFILAGSFFALPRLQLVIWLCLAAVIALGTGFRWRSAVLNLHGMFYLTAAAVESGLLAYGGRALLGEHPAPPDLLPLVAAVATLVCTAILWQHPGDRREDRLLRMWPATLGAFAADALAVSATLWFLVRGGTLAPSQLAVMRNAVVCAVAFLLTFLGGRGKRLELVWIAYAAVGLGCLKLVLLDLRLSTTVSLSVSLLIYGIALILIPKVHAGVRRT